MTGGSRGIGAEIVRRLAADGAAVAFTYGASAAEAEKLVAEVAETGGTAVAIQADSGDPEQVARSVDETVAELGGLDILVNNAGVAYVDDAESFPLEQFDRLVAVNVRARLRRDPAGASRTSATAAGSSTSAASTPTACPRPACRCTR